MHPRVRRAVSLALSLAAHALVLLLVATQTLTQPGFVNEAPMPVRIIEDRPNPRAARQPPPPPVAAKPPEAAKPIEEPPPEVPPPKEPERQIPLPEQQIVSPSDTGKSEAPPETRLLSDRDNRVDEQMVKRGNPAPGESSPEEKVAQPAKPAKPVKPAARPSGGGQKQRQPPPQVAALPGLDRLLPDALRLAEEGYGAAPDSPPGEQVAQANLPRRLTARGADGLMVGPSGTMDFLPDVREGHITLLNTKADVFAPFVRRVATRVFQNFIILLKHDLFSSGIATNEVIQAEAVMDAKGEMIGFQIHQRSTRIALASDRRLQQACTDAFFDRNPPPGARAKDGKIHFLFITEIQSQPSPSGPWYIVRMGVGLG